MNQKTEDFTINKLNAQASLRGKIFKEQLKASG